MSDPIEQAVREAINELENLISKYTIAHPENTMRVLGLLWADQRRIADYLRRSLDAHDEEAEAERDRLAETVDRVRALHYPNTTFGICVEDGDRWPCPTIRTLDEDPT